MQNMLRFTDINKNRVAAAKRELEQNSNQTQVSCQPIMKEVNSFRIVDKASRLQEKAQSKKKEKLETSIERSVSLQRDLRFKTSTRC
jgi:hypothetical protein